LFASYVACAAHDVGHDGHNNIYHINTGSELALRYNDQSVLENHHASLGWRLLKQNNFLNGMLFFNDLSKTHIKEKKITTSIQPS